MELRYTPFYSYRVNFPILYFHADLKQVTALNSHFITRIADSTSHHAPMIETACEFFSSYRRKYCSQTCSLNYWWKKRYPFSILRSSWFWKHTHCPSFQAKSPQRGHRRLCLAQD